MLQEDLAGIQYPYVADTVPSWSVPVYSTLGPVLYFTAHHQLSHVDATTYHNACLGSLSSVAVTALFTNIVKVTVRTSRMVGAGRVASSASRPQLAVSDAVHCASKASTEALSGGVAVAPEPVQGVTLKELCVGTSVMTRDAEQTGHGFRSSHGRAGLKVGETAAQGA